VAEQGRPTPRSKYEKAAKELDRSFVGTHPTEKAFRRVVIAWREPSLFVADCQGYEILRNAGVEVVELADLADDAKAANAHLPLGP
jgi:hypothetical protein